MPKPARRGDELADRLLRFGAAASRIVAELPKDHAGTHVAKQLTRSATAAGASYAEARGAESRRDFIHKLRVADKEARESEYWLRFIAERWGEYAEPAAAVAVEAGELVAILTASVRTALSQTGAGLSSER
jgi:four helix bundle protein